MIAMYLVIVATSSSLWDDDEPRFARAAVEMLERGDLLTPTFNGDLRPDKPAMVYWLMMPGLAVFGAAEIAVRLPSVLGMTAASVFTFFIGRRMFGPRVGWWAMLILPTTLQTLVIGTAATADGTLIAWITLGVWAFVEIVYAQKTPWVWWIVLTLALGFGQLTKGPVALAAVGLTVVFAAVLGRGAVGLRKTFWLWFALSVLASLGMFAAWYLPANAATGGELGEKAVGRHLIERILTPLEGHGGSGLLGYLALLPFYAVALCGGFFPWVLMLPGGLSALIRKHLGGPRERAILWAWIVPTFVMMSLVATKLPHYILPIYPALAILCGAVIEARLQERLSEKDRDWLRGGIWFFGVVNLILAGGLIIGPWFIGGWGLIIAGTMLGLLLIGIGEIIVRFQRREQVVMATRVVLLQVMFGVMLGSQLVLPEVEREAKPSPELAGVVTGSDVVAAGYSEPSLVFYLNRPADQPLRFLGADPASLAQWARENRSGTVITRSDILDAAREQFGDLGLVVTLRRPTIDYSAQGKRLELIVAQIGAPHTHAGLERANGSEPLSSDELAVEQQGGDRAEVGADEHVADVVGEGEDAGEGDGQTEDQP